MKNKRRYIKIRYAQRRFFANAVGKKSDTVRSFANIVGKKSDMVRSFANAVGKKSDMVRSFANAVGKKSDMVRSFANTVGRKSDMVRLLLIEKLFRHEKRKGFISPFLHLQTIATSVA